jgi:hypothetical protein
VKWHHAASLVLNLDGSAGWLGLVGQQQLHKLRARIVRRRCTLRSRRWALRERDRERALSGMGDAGGMNSLGSSLARNARPCQQQRHCRRPPGRRPPRQGPPSPAPSAQCPAPSAQRPAPSGERVAQRRHRAQGGCVDAAAMARRMDAMAYIYRPSQPAHTGSRWPPQSPIWRERARARVRERARARARESCAHRRGVLVLRAAGARLGPPQNLSASERQPRTRRAE